MFDDYVAWWLGMYDICFSEGNVFDDNVACVL